MSETSTEKLISEGDDVLLFLDSKRSYLVKAKPGEKLHTHRGFIQFSEVVGKRFGDKVSSNLGSHFYLLRPNVYDYLGKSLRATQIIYLKDIALITAYSGVGPGSRVVEAGTGSGALTSALAYHVGSEGRVYSYDVKAEFQEKAARNLLRAGVQSMLP